MTTDRTVNWSDTWSSAAYLAWRDGNQMCVVSYDEHSFIAPWPWQAGDNGRVVMRTAHPTWDRV
jgi:hypothetical protein